jgi:hypothetical protein
MSHRVHKSLLIALALFLVHIRALSVMLQSQEPYCFAINVKKNNDIKVYYMISGLNEDQVDFKV